MEPSPALVDRVARVIGSRPISWRRVQGGYTNAERWVAGLEREAVFLKVAADAPTAGWLRDEHKIYETLRGDFLPALRAWDDDGALPMLVLEDLSAARWPPPWNPGDVDRVLASLSQLAATRAPAFVKSLEAERETLSGWRRVAADPRPFLSLGLCGAAWLERALPALLRAAEQAVLDGDALLHLDVRSDNICFARHGALLVDWNWACRGDRRMDIAFWLPSLHAEGGPAPEEVLKDEPELAALCSGFFASMAGLPVIPHAPRVRVVQRQQLETALPWAVRALDLPPLALT